MIKEYLQSVIGSTLLLDVADIEKAVNILSTLRGRLFIIGSGGGAGHASHAACDFRKLCHIEAYAPYDNVSELTARANDEGFDTTLINYLKVSKFNHNDCLLVISVGGGSSDVSLNLVRALRFAHSKTAKIIGIVGRDGGETKKYSDVCILIETKDHVTPITEGLQAVIWHGIVSHPKLQKQSTKW